MKRIYNKAPKRSHELVEIAKSIGIEASIIKKAKGGYRKDGPFGSTWSPQKIVILNGLKFSVGGAQQYINARVTKNNINNKKGV